MRYSFDFLTDWFCSFVLSLVLIPVSGVRFVLFWKELQFVVQISMYGFSFARVIALEFIVGYYTQVQIHWFSISLGW